jgi:hypothetical protein
MDKIKYILLLLFIGFNMLVAASLLLKAFAAKIRARWPEANRPRVARRASTKVRGRVWTAAVWRGQKPARTI